MKCLLITHRHAGLNKVKNQEDFDAFWSKAFAENIGKKWATCCEKHKGRDKAHCLKLKNGEAIQKVIFEIKN